MGQTGMQVRIFRPPKTAMQSGRNNTQQWVLEYEPETPRRPEPLMGWVSSGDTLNQVRMVFATVEDAISFAKRKGLSYTVIPTQERRPRPRNYADNFKPRPS